MDLASLTKTCDVVIFFRSIVEGEGCDRSLLILPSEPANAAKSLENEMIVDEMKAPNINIDQERMIGRPGLISGKKVGLLLPHRTMG